jgi:hypothetical protein
LVEAVLQVLSGLGQLLYAAANVSARKILLGLTKLFARLLEVLSGLVSVILVVVVVMMMAALGTFLAALIEETLQCASQLATQLATQHVSETFETRHSIFSFLLMIPAPASCRTLGGATFAD